MSSWAEVTSADLGIHVSKQEQWWALAMEVQERLVWRPPAAKQVRGMPRVRCLTEAKMACGDWEWTCKQSGLWELRARRGGGCKRKRWHRAVLFLLVRGVRRGQTLQSSVQATHRSELALVMLEDTGAGPAATVVVEGTVGVVLELVAGRCQAGTRKDWATAGKCTLTNVRKGKEFETERESLKGGGELNWVVRKNRALIVWHMRVIDLH